MRTSFVKLSNFLAYYALNIVFFISLLAAIGSMFLSNVILLPPCDLCWWQRILMYPIAVISGLGMLWHDKFTTRYVLAFSIPGLFLSLYHFLIQTTDLENLVAPGCSAVSNCANIDFAIAGFITIPLMSLVAFTFITAMAMIRLTSEK